MPRYADADAEERARTLMLLLLMLPAILRCYAMRCFDATRYDIAALDAYAICHVADIATR